MAPAIAGVYASCPAIYRSSISVSGLMTHRDDSQLENCKLHLVPYEPPLYYSKKFASDIGVPHSYHILSFTWGTSHKYELLSNFMKHNELHILVSNSNNSLHVQV